MKILALASALALVIEARKKPCCKPSASCDECLLYVARMDFYHVKPILAGLGRNWSYRQYLDYDGVGGSDYIANDGTYSSDCKGAVVDSSVFTKWAPPNQQPGVSRDKFFIFADAPAAIPTHGKLIVEFEGSGQTFKGDQSPFPSEIIQSNDVRTTNVQFNTFDLVSGFEFNWILTNDRVYASYARNHVSDAAVFLYILPVMQRRPSDWHNMKIVFDGERKHVTFILDGHHVLRLTKLGYKLDDTYLVVDQGGFEGAAWPSSIQYGFGTFALIDGYPACKRPDRSCNCNFPPVRQALTNTDYLGDLPYFDPLLGAPTLATFWQPNQVPILANQVDFIWGQGAKLWINKLVVYQDRCSPCYKVEPVDGHGQPGDLAEEEDGAVFEHTFIESGSE